MGFLLLTFSSLDCNRGCGGGLDAFIASFMATDDDSLTLVQRYFFFIDVNVLLLVVTV